MMQIGMMTVLVLATIVSQVVARRDSISGNNVLFTSLVEDGEDGHVGTHGAGLMQMHGHEQSVITIPESLIQTQERGEALTTSPESVGGGSLQIKDKFSVVVPAMPSKFSLESQVEVNAQNDMQRLSSYAEATTRKEIKKSEVLRIPKIAHITFHRTAKPGSPSYFPKEWTSWENTQVGWELREWHKDSNRGLIEERFPWFLKTYDSLRDDINRLDSTRYAYMHAFGGVYADSDVVATKPLEPFLAGNDLVLYSPHESIEPAWMASVPGLELWTVVLKAIQAVASLPASRNLDLNRIDANSQAVAPAVCSTGWALVGNVWNHIFHGHWKGTGVVDGAKATLYDKQQFRSVLGLIHEHHGSWVKKPFHKGWRSQCEKLIPGWSNAILEVGKEHHSETEDLSKLDSA